MVELLKLAFRISRVRFWLYLGGTYLLGYAFGAQELKEFINIEFFFYLFLFLIPANVFLYGVNDYYDFEEDKKNPKKEGYEHRVVDKERNDLSKIVLYSFLFFVVAIMLNFELTQLILLVVFVYLSYAYSAKPVRFKARPILDFSSNALYFIPGLIGYHQASGMLPGWEIILSLFLWTSAMHLFSAIPDIKYDREAGIITTAVKFGKKISLSLCFIFWAGFAGILFIRIPIYLWIILLVYPIIPLLILIFPKINIKKIYKIYPYMTGIIGFVFFIYVILK